MEVLVKVPGLRGAYVIESRRAESATYFARDPHGRRCLLSMAALEPPIAPDVVERFAREAAALMLVDHPALERYADAFVFDGVTSHPPHAVPQSALEGPLSMCLVQRVPDGASLDVAIGRRERLGAKRIEPLLTITLDGLVHLHTRGLIHGDVRPENLFIGPRPSLIGGPLPSVIAAQNRGRPIEFQPLESLMGNAKPQGDLYALGMTLVFGASGLTPIEIQPPDDHTGFDLSELSRAFSPKTFETLGRMISTRASERPGDARVARAAITRAERRRWLRWIAASVLAVLVGMIAALVVAAR